MARHEKKDIKILYAYAEEDEELRNELHKHLSPLRQRGIIKCLDHRIPPGAERATELTRKLKAADIILLLISADFIASSHCYQVQMKHALERHDAGEAQVIPIILRPVYIQGTPFKELEALPQNRQPVTEWADKDKAFVDIVDGIARALEYMEQQKSLDLDGRDRDDFNQQKIEEEFLKQSSQSAALLPSTNVSMKLADYRRKLVIEYDLEYVIKKFKDQLVPGQAFGFTIAGDLYVLSHYVIERIEQEFRKEIRGELCSVSIDLYQDLQLSIPVESLFETRIKRCFGYTSAQGLVRNHPQEHVILTVRNHGLPLQFVEEAANSFWQRFKLKLCRKNLYFVLILAHLSPIAQPCSLQDFTPLELPPFDVPGSLRRWVIRRLDEFGVPAHARAIYLNQLEDGYTNPLQILLCMERMAETLQGKYNKGRFDEVKIHVKRRSLPK